MSIQKHLYWAIIVAVLGSLIFGINMAAIAGAVPFIKDKFALTDLQLGLVVSSIIIGCMIGAFTAGPMSQRFGRRIVFVGTSILFIISALGSGLANSPTFLFLARLVGGIGVGGVSVTVPTYISEISPTPKRGTLGTMNQLGIVIGILLAYILDYAFVHQPEGWRWMLASPIFFAVPFFLFLFIKFPESPRWLVVKGFNEKAQNVLQSILELKMAHEELQTIIESVAKDTHKSDKDITFTKLFTMKYRKVVLLGIGLAALQQITGINAIVSYAPAIFEKTGIMGNIALQQSILVGLINLISTFVAVWLIDIVGRKVLLLVGAAGTSVSLSYLVWAFLSNNFTNIGVLISILGFIAFFAASWSPVMWVVTSEIYPNRIRGVAMALSTAVSWLCTFLTVQFFPWLLTSLGGEYAFGIFLFFSVIAFLFVLLKIPETKGKSLEVLEKEIGIGQ